MAVRLNAADADFEARFAALLAAKRETAPQVEETSEVIGDYVAGSNHVLPTARSARFSSGLSVLDFMKRTSLVQLSADSLRRLGPAAIALAGAEGLEGHARSIAIRLNL